MARRTITSPLLTQAEATRRLRARLTSQFPELRPWQIDEIVASVAAGVPRATAAEPVPRPARLRTPRHRA